MFRTRLALSILVAGCALTPLPAAALTFAVDSTELGSDDDLSDNACKDAAGLCTLQAAIEQANATPGADAIAFAIPGAGPHVIGLTYPETLAAITGDLVINGYTQPGASPNTLSRATDAQIDIEIVSNDGVGEGLRVQGGAVALIGLAVRGFGTCVLFDPLVASVASSVLLGSRVEGCQEGVRLNGDVVRIGGATNADRNLISNNLTGIYLAGGSQVVDDNLIGTDATGSAALGNHTGILIAGGSFHAITDNVISGNLLGVAIAFSSDNTFVRNLIGVGADGGTALANLRGIDVDGTRNRIGLPSGGFADANVISANGLGLRITGPGNLVQGNYIGTGAGGGGSLGNDDGIEIYASGNVIGAAASGLVAGQGNVIANSVNSGISLPPFLGQPIQPRDNSLRGNRLYGNGLSDIDLGDNGPDFIDPGDADTGSNNRQNPPELVAVGVAAGHTVIGGRLDTLPGTYTLDFYSSPTCDAGGDTGTGRFYLGSDSVTVVSGPLVFSSAIATTAQGDAFSAMATDANGNSSELAPCFVATSSSGADLSLEVTIDGGVAQVLPGDDVRVQVRVENAGPDTATSVPVLVARPDGFDAWSSSGAGSYDEASGIWSAGDLAPGAFVTRVFDATIGAGAAGLLPVLAEAEQNLAEPDPDLTNNQSSVSFDVHAGAELVIALNGPSNSEPDASISLEILVRNDGPEEATGVALAGHLDAGLELVLASAPAGIDYSATTGNWSLAVGDLALSESTAVVLPVHVASATPHGVALAHTVSASATNTADPTPGSSTQLVVIGVSGDVALVAIDTVHVSAEEAPRPGWDFLILNAGPDPITGVELRVESCGASTLQLGPGGSRYCRDVGDCGDLTCDGSACPLTCRLDGLRGVVNGERISIHLDPLPNALLPAMISARVAPSAADPFYDTNRENDFAIWLPSYQQQFPFSCGLLGIESPILFGLLLLARGRVGRGAG